MLTDPPAVVPSQISDYPLLDYYAKELGLDALGQDVIGAPSQYLSPASEGNIIGPGSDQVLFEVDAPMTQEMAVTQALMDAVTPRPQSDLEMRVFVLWNLWMPFAGGIAGAYDADGVNYQTQNQEDIALQPLMNAGSVTPAEQTQGGISFSAGQLDSSVQNMLQIQRFPR